MTPARRRLAWAVVATASFQLVAAHALPETSDDEAAVRATFEAYRQALMAGDGETAAALVDRDTGAYFGELKRLALEGSEEEVRQRTFVDRLLVVAFRHQFAGEELAAMQLADVVVRATEIGWINSAGDRATGRRRGADRGERGDGRRPDPGVARGSVARGRDGRDRVPLRQ